MLKDVEGRQSNQKSTKNYWETAAKAASEIVSAPVTELQETAEP